MKLFAAWRQSKLASNQSKLEDNSVKKRITVTDLKTVFRHGVHFPKILDRFTNLETWSGLEFHALFELTKNPLDVLMRTCQKRVINMDEEQERTFEIKRGLTAQTLHPQVTEDLVQQIEK